MRPTMLRTLSPTEPELLELCKSASWGSVSSRVQAYPEEAQVSEAARHGERTTVLSMRVRARAPLHVVQNTLEADYSQISIVHSIRGTILHEALKHRVADDILGYLVHEAVKHEQSLTLKRSSPWFLKTDELGRTALHYMVDRIVRCLERGGPISSLNKEVFRMLVNVCPQSVGVIDADGSTPLVLLLIVPRFGDDPLGKACEDEIRQVVSFMVEKYPPAIKVVRRLPNPWHQHSNLDNSPSHQLEGDGIPSPLSCAILHSRSMDTINLLLHTNQSLGVNACNTIVTYYREVPLHIATTMRCSVELIDKLVQQEPRVVNIPDIHGLRPLDWVWIRHVLDWCSPTPFAFVNISRRRHISTHFLQWHQRVSNQYLEIDRTLGASSQNPAVRESVRHLRLELLERMAKLLPLMAMQSIQSKASLRQREFGVSDRMDLEDDSKTSIHLVHAACCVDCPLALVALACENAPHQLRTKDGQKQRLPLHYAAARSGYKRQFPIGVTGTTQGIEEVSPIRLLLSKCPSACRVRDGSNQLPLHIAIDQAKERTRHEQSVGYPAATFSARERGRTHRVAYKQVDAILEKYPDALHKRDGATKLYPFQQAAEGPSGDVELTFLLLRRDPTLMHFAPSVERDHEMSL